MGFKVNTAPSLPGRDVELVTRENVVPESDLDSEEIEYRSILGDILQRN
jgi:hypothetical protein